MASRMERYYQSDEDNKRTTKNMSLYREIYADKEYDRDVENVNDISVDTIATLNDDKRIDISEVKALLEKRDEYQRTRQIVKEQPIMKRENIYYEPESDKIYSINDMIEKAKVEKNETYRPRSLADTQVLTLQEIIKKKDYSTKNQIDESEMKDLIDTIYKTNMLKSDNGMGLLDDLKSTGNTVVTPSIKEVLKEKKEEMEQQDTGEIDKSFYTSSLGFKKSDFQKLDDIDEDVEKSNKSTIIFLIVLTLIFIIAAAYIVIKYVLI